MKTHNKWIICSALLAFTALAAFAPPGVVFSKVGRICPTESIVTESSSTDALVATGTSPMVDGSLIANDHTIGIYVFPVHETTGLELHFGMEGALGVTGTARVWRAIPVARTPGESTISQWTYRHICDVSLVGSAQAGTGSAIVRSTLRWATVTVTASADGGLSTRAFNGTTASAAGSLFVDPIGAPYIVVQVKRDTASGILPLASDWTRN